MPTDTSHRNLAINGILRQIDTLLTTQTVGSINVKILQAKITDLHECLEKHPDEDIPNDVFVGVTNDTRRLVFDGFALACMLNSVGCDVVQKILKDLDGPKPENN